MFFDAEEHVGNYVATFFNTVSFTHTLIGRTTPKYWIGKRVVERLLCKILSSIFLFGVGKSIYPQLKILNKNFNTKTRIDSKKANYKAKNTKYNNVILI